MDTTTEPAAEVTAAPPPIPGRRHLFAVVVGVLAIVALVFVTMACISTLSVRRNLIAGRDALSEGKAALLKADTAGAAAAFSRAEVSFQEGSDGARSIWMGIAGAIPLVGRTPDAVRAVADAGLETARAAVALTTAVNDLPGGLGALAPTNGGIPLDGLTGLTDAVARAVEQTGEALRTLQLAPTTLVLPSVAAARADAVDELERVHSGLVAGTAILRGMPAFLGSDGPRQYFFGASNPAELRGTGGLIGAYAILTVDDGRLSFSDFRPVQSLPLLNVADVPSPSSEYSTNFDYARTGVGFWVNINMTPDFPLAARATWLAYRAATGVSLDGVIVADPFALKALMRVTDPVPVGTSGLTLNEHTIVPFTTNRAYAMFDTNEERKLVLGRVAKAVLDGFLSQDGDPQARIRALLGAFDDGHVKVWSADEQMQAGLALTGVGGSYRPPGTDAIAVITNSASGTKLDYYQERTVRYDVELGPAGTATATLETALKNDSPTSGYPPYVIGPYKQYSTRPGENVASVDLYCGHGCILDSATRNGRPATLDPLHQEGYPFYEDYVRTRSGGTADISANLTLPDAWNGDDTGGTYQLGFTGQTTIRPTSVHIVVHAPQGMGFTSWTGGFRQQGDALVYDGRPRGNLDLRASFAPSFLPRLWRELLQKVS